MIDRASVATIDRSTDPKSSNERGSDAVAASRTLRNVILKTARAPEVFRIPLPDAEAAEAVLEVRPVLPSVIEETGDVRATITGSIEGEPYSMSVPAAALATWVERILPLVAWDDLEARARADVLEYLFAPFIDMLENRAVKRIRLDKVGPAPADAPGPDFAFLLRLDDMTIHAAGCFAPEIVQDLTRWASGLPRRVAEGVAVPVSIRRGFCALTLDELGRLGVGDGLVFENQEVDAGYVVAGETLGAPCRFDGDRAVLVSPFRQSSAGPGRSWMSSALGPTDVARNPTEGATGTITVPVVFDIGRLEMTIDELNALGEGHVFALDRFPRSLVEIVVHGKIIGRGEIIDHDAILAVRVTSLVA